MKKSINNKGNFHKIRLTKNFFLWVSTILLVFLTIFMFTRNVTYGIKLSEAEKEEFELIRKKEELLTKLFNGSSLLHMKDSADDLGYSVPQNTYYIKVDDFVAAAR